MKEVNKSFFAVSVVFDFNCGEFTGFSTLATTQRLMNTEIAIMVR